MDSPSFISFFNLLPSCPGDETKATSLEYDIQKLLLDNGHDHGHDVSKGNENQPLVGAINLSLLASLLFTKLCEAI